jgi:hypothetical protein
LTKLRQIGRGPYLAKAVKTRNQKDIKIALSNGHGGLATGIYFCDVYVHKAVISLPLNTVGRADIPNPVGYNNITNQESGITTFMNSSQTKNELIVYTTTIHVKWNILGQSINVVIPNSLPNTFNYKYYYLPY